MRSGVVLVGVILLLAGAFITFGPTLAQTSCTASPYKSVVFTGQITDATTGAGLQGAVITWADPPYSNNQVGTSAGSNGYYYEVGMPINPFRGCDSIEVLVTKPQTPQYRIIDEVFQLPDNQCYPVNNSCNSVTIGANYALVLLQPLTASFKWSANGLIVTFTDTSTGSPNGWGWVFGDACGSSQCSTLQNPTHTYSAGGTYTVTETAYVLGQSQSVATQTITVTQGQQNQGNTAPPACPTGYTGTYPNCIPPSYSTTNNTSNNTTNKTYTPPPSSPGGTWSMQMAAGVLLMFGGFMIAAVGAASKSGP